MIEVRCDFNALQKTWAGRIIFLLLPFKKSIAKKNIQHVFKESLTSKEKRHLAIAYYSHVMALFKEIILFALLPKNHLQRRIKIIGIEHLHNATKKNNGVIVLTGHFGNWEFAPLFLRSQMNTKRQLYCIRKSLRFEFLNNIFFHRFEKAGFSIINKQNALEQVDNALKNKGIVFFPFDIKPPDHYKYNLEVDFLGKKTTSYTSLAYLAEKHSLPVLSATCYRTNKKQHIIEFYPELDRSDQGYESQTLSDKTKLYNKRIEEMLLAHPEQWLWSYKRW